MEITIQSDDVWGCSRIAAYLGLDHEFKILRRLKAGEVAGARCIGGRWCVSRRDLDAYRAVMPEPIYYRKRARA